MSLSALLRLQGKRIAYGLNVARVSRTVSSPVLRQFSTSLFLQQQRWGLRQDAVPARHDGNRGADSFGQDIGRTSFRKPNPPSSSLYVGNLPYTIESADIQAALEPFGPITEVRMAYSPDGRFKGFAHVEFANESDAVQLIDSSQDQPLYVGNRQLRLDYGVAKRLSARDSEPYHVLHVFKFPGQPKDLVSAFKEFGVKSSNIRGLKDKETGEFTGKFWVDMGSIERATEARQKLHDTHTADGHLLRVAFARPRPISTNYGGEWGGGKKASAYQQPQTYFKDSV